MAKFHSELPNDLIKVFEDLETNCDEMFGEMCKAGAAVVYNNVMANMKKVFKSTRSLEKGLKITKVYHTPSDDGINVHVGFYGYNDEGVPIPLIAQAREYGTSRNGKEMEKKKPFFRKSFKKKDIEQAMQIVQDKYIKGD
jgi:hypothetical protein